MSPAYPMLSILTEKDQTVGTDKDYSRDTCSVLNTIYKYTSFLQSLGLYLCW